MHHRRRNPNKRGYFLLYLKECMELDASIRFLVDSGTRPGKKSKIEVNCC
jgi:hypothetical protein